MADSLFILYRNNNFDHIFYLGTVGIGVSGSFQDLKNIWKGKIRMLFFSKSGWGNPQFFLKDITKIVAVVKSGQGGDFRQGKFGIDQQFLSVVDFHHGKEIGIGTFQPGGEKP